MTYFVLNTIKSELGITDYSMDSQLNSWGTEADDYVNNKLAPYVATPINTPDNNLINASNYGVIGRFYKARYISSVPTEGMQDRSNDYLKLADRFIDIYIQRLLLTKSATLIPQYMVSTSGNVYVSDS